MAGMGSFRQFGAAASARGFEHLLEHFIAVARVDPTRVVNEARRHGLPVVAEDAAAGIASLRRLPPSALDPVAGAFVRANSAVAGAQGFVAGLGGVATLPIMLSADTVGALYWIVRATSGVAGAYGFETQSEDGAAGLRVALLVAMGVGTVRVEGAHVSLEQVSRQVLSTPYSQRLLSAGGRRLARRLGAGAARGRAARVVPLVGGAVGGAINVGLVQSAGRRAQRYYRARLVEWQEERAKIAPPGQEPPPALPPPSSAGGLAVPERPRSSPEGTSPGGPSPRPR